MSGEAEKESKATAKALAWIGEFVAAIGDLAQDANLTLVGEKVSVEIISGDVTYRHEYDQRTSVPALSANHFRRQVIETRSAQGVENDSWLILSCKSHGTRARAHPTPKQCPRPVTRHPLIKRPDHRSLL
jgi:hypothetical protein